MARDPVASSPASSSCTRWTSVATSQSASRAIVCPTARVRLTAMSKSMTPRVDQPEQRRDGVGVGLGEGPLGAAVGEAQRPPEPAGLVDGRAGLVGHLEGVEDDVLAQDRLLESDGSTGGTLARAVGRRAASGSALVRRRRSSPSRAVEPAEEVHQLCAARARRRGMSWSRTEPWVLASLITSVPQPSIRSIGALVVGDVADPQQRDVVAAARDQALAGDQALGGDRVRRGEPVQERPDRPHHERSPPAMIHTTQADVRRCRPGSR